MVGCKFLIVDGYFCLHTFVIGLHFLGLSAIYLLDDLHDAEEKNHVAIWEALLCNIFSYYMFSSLVRQAYAVTIKCDAWPMFKICSDDTIGFTLLGDSCREKFELMISDLELRHYDS